MAITVKSVAERGLDLLSACLRRVAPWFVVRRALQRISPMHLGTVQGTPLRATPVQNGMWLATIPSQARGLRRLALALVPALPAGLVVRFWGRLPLGIERDGEEALAARQVDNGHILVITWDAARRREHRAMCKREHEQYQQRQRAEDAKRAAQRAKWASQRAANAVVAAQDAQRIASTLHAAAE